MEKIAIFALESENGGGGGGGSRTPVLVAVVTNGDSMPTQRPDGTPLVLGDYVRANATSTFPLNIGSQTFNSAKDTAVWMGSDWQMNVSAFQYTNETPVKTKTIESIGGNADFQSDINIENANIIGKNKTLSVSNKDNIIDALNYLALIDDITLERNTNGKIRLKVKTSADKDKVYKVQSDGTWDIENIREWKSVQTFSALTPNDYTLYILTENITISGTEYKKGFYTWDSTNGYVMRSAMTEVDNNTIEYDTNNKLSLKKQTASDENKAFRVNNSGGWSLSNIKEWKKITELDVTKGNNYTLYFYTPGFKGLKLTSNQDGSTLAYTVTGIVDKDIQISEDGETWSSWDGSSITLNNGESRYIWNKNSTLNSIQGKLNFSILGSISANNDISSMINFTELKEQCYSGLFKGCSGLTQAPNLPATTLAKECYLEMFMNCTNLSSIPELPATTLVENCYYSMFKGCTNLSTQPVLNATVLAKGCYRSMFMNCTNLSTAPDLPVLILPEQCYQDMFNGCRGLTSSPELLATSLSTDCYRQMFYNCSNLNRVYIYDLNMMGTSKSRNYLYGVPEEGNLYVKQPTPSIINTGSSTVPEWWDIHQY